MGLLELGGVEVLDVFGCQADFDAGRCYDVAWM